jgi:hypothetical protein
MKESPMSNKGERKRKRSIEKEQDFGMASEMGHGSIIYTMDVGYILGDGGVI